MYIYKYIYIYIYVYIYTWCSPLKGLYIYIYIYIFLTRCDFKLNFVHNFRNIITECISNSFGLVIFVKLVLFE